MASTLAFSVIALPGNVFAISKIGSFIAQKIRLYNEAPSILAELREFGTEIHKGQLYTNIVLAQAFTADFDEPHFTAQLDKQIRRFKAGLDEVQQTLSKSYDDKGEINQVRFTASLASQLVENLEQLRKCQSDFDSLVNSLDILRRQRESMTLTHSVFLPSIDDKGNYSEPVPGTSHAHTGHAEWKRGDMERQNTFVLFERHECKARILHEVLDTLVYLAAHLPREPFPKSGILRCLGYRKEPIPELVFEVPESFSRPRTLRSLLKSNVQSKNSTILKADKLQFAYMVSTAVSNAQRVGLLHKNIRPESILLLKDDRARGDPPSAYKTWVPFLTNWTFARTEEMLSYRLGDDDWQKNLYRHPQRQGLHVEERFNAGHDIYSLGVCLLEIGLSESLIVLDDNNAPNLCGLFQEEAMRLRFVTSSSASTVHAKIKPPQLAATLYALSKAELSSRMGPEYSTVVQQCLCCIEQGFGPIQDFNNYQDHDVNSILHDIVLKHLE